MVIEVHVEGLDNYKKAADEHKGKVIFVLFSGSTDSEGNNWCPDCVAADPVIQKCLSSAPDDAVFIHCGVGDRTFWKDQTNSFRTDPELKLKSVPTLIVLGKSQRLEEEQCAKEDLVKMLFSGED